VLWPPALKGRAIEAAIERISGAAAPR
jgi:hypothetical protein